MLGHRQRDTLARYAKMINTAKEPALIIVRVHGISYRSSRNGGNGYNVSVNHMYASDKTVDLTDVISRCEYPWEAINKGKEIGRYLCDKLGLSRDVVKLRDYSGEWESRKQGR